MTTPAMDTSQQGKSHDEDWVCSYCGCEIMVKHHGDPAKMGRESVYTCRCGTRMDLEHPERGSFEGQGTSSPSRA